MGEEKTLVAEDEVVETEGSEGKRGLYERYFSGIELSMGSGSLKDLDGESLKNEIKRWAKAVVAYARQLSGSFTSMTRQLSGSFSFRERSEKNQASTYLSPSSSSLEFQDTEVRRRETAVHVKEEDQRRCNGIIEVNVDQ